MKNKKGFTLIELLAVIVILGVIIAIAGYSVLKNINDSKNKTKYIAAKEIVEIAGAYIESEIGLSQIGDNETSACIKVTDMLRNGYLEGNVTNPKTGKNYSNASEENSLERQLVCQSFTSEQEEYTFFEEDIDDHQFYIYGETNSITPTKYYKFNGYIYVLEYNE